MNNIEMLRWVLAGIGIFLVVLLYWFGRADKRNYRKRENNMRPKSVEPYMSNDALNLDLNASQKEEISREIQASPITEGVFDKVDELYEEVTDREAVHDEVVAVPLPSFSAHSEPVKESPSTETDSATSNSASDAQSRNAVDYSDNVPAWLQQTDKSAQAEPNTESTSATSGQAQQRTTGTVGLFAGDERNPDIAPVLPEQNKQVKATPLASESSGMPENYSDKIKQAVAAIQNIERSKEESVPENRNLFDRLPPSNAGKKQSDSGIRDENIFANSKDEAEALNEALAAVEENAGEVQSPKSDAKGEVESEVKASPTVTSEQGEQQKTDVEIEIDDQTNGQDENDTDVNTDKSAQQEAGASQEALADTGQNIDSNANQQDVEQTNALLQGSEVTESAKSTAAGGHTVFYPSTESEREQGTSTGSSDETQQLKAEQDSLIQKEDNTVVRIDPSRFRKSEAQLAAQNQTETKDDSQADAESKAPEEVKGNSASIQLVESKTTEENSHQEEQVKIDSGSDNELSPSIESEDQPTEQQTLNDVSETDSDGQTKSRVNGFDRDNPEADLVSFYLVNSEKPYKAHDIMRLAQEHGLEFDKNNTMYMAQDSGFAKDYVFSVASIDENCQLHKNEDPDAATKAIVFRLLQGKEIMGRLNMLDSMLRLAKHIEGELGGALFDVGYCPITDLMISHLRRQIQENDVKNCQ